MNELLWDLLYLSLEVILELNFSRDGNISLSVLQLPGYFSIIFLIWGGTCGAHCFTPSLQHKPWHIVGT